ncbi:MAG TPA: DUF411 domain-containing protein [Gemmatimonadales bacterium]
MSNRTRAAARLLLGCAALSVTTLAACGGESASATPDAGDRLAAATPQPVASQADAAPAVTTSGAPHVTVYKSPTCGCCTAWEEHMRDNGFAVTSRPTDDLGAVKAKHGIGRNHESCHTAVVDGYVIEGHVPADLVAKLLTERPDGVVALTVPGMPMGSPGMEGPYKDAYDVIALHADGRSTVYAKR